ncbi:MAG: hypothetical protein AAFZ15_13980 [Bacteroidota bacterium]
MKYCYLFSLLITTLVSGCFSKGNNQTSPKSLPDYFQKTEPADTLLFEINDAEEINWTDTLSNRLFFSKMETQLMNGVEYFDNSGRLTVIGRTRFSFNDQLDAYLVDMRQHWYRNLSIFIFDLQKEIFIHRETVAEFYGGEGGQILTGSWLMDFDGDGSKDLVRHEVEHWIILDDDNPRDTLTQHAAFLAWEANKFLEKEANTEALVKQFPIKLFW